jgi:hypothetical protein
MWNLDDFIRSGIHVEIQGITWLLNIGKNKGIHPVYMSTITEQERAFPFYKRPMAARLQWTASQSFQRRSSHSSVSDTS